ncbi:MAG: amidohydrolase family protein [Ramlibacter sp.]|nr:amidohydrolase family protein [Ramlibacter sp.]
MALTAPALLVGPDRHGRSVAVAGGLVVGEAPPDAARLPCPEGEISAGAVCAHTHLYSGLARHGMPPATPAPESFVEILERVWWKLDRALDAQSLRASALDYVARALLAGTTALVDHHESPNLIEGSIEILAGACEQLGVRALLCYGATERNFGADEARRGLDECRRVPASPLLRGLVGLHASFTVSDQTIQAAGQLARELGTVLHVHVAEDQADVADALARGYPGPLERLERLGALPRGTILAHGVHLSAEQVRRAGELGCWLVHNPRSNEGNRVGYARKLGESGRVALGCDGWDADMTVEQQALDRLAAAHGDTRTGERLARGNALIAERFGTRPEPLQPGALGDLVVRQHGAIQHVVVGGRVVVAKGALVTGDFDAITAQARAQAERLWLRMASL